VHLYEACERQNFWRFWRASDAAHQNAFVFTAQYAKIFPQVFLTSQNGEAASPNPTEKICRHIKFCKSEEQLPAMSGKIDGKRLSFLHLMQQLNPSFVTSRREK
jgi:3-hydroxy-3-methylglutaryl CoA synthase